MQSYQNLVSDLGQATSFCVQLQPSSVPRGKFRPEKLLQLLELPAVLALSCRIPRRRLADAARTRYLNKRPHSLQREPAFDKQRFKHDSSVRLSTSTAVVVSRNESVSSRRI